MKLRLALSLAAMLTLMAACHAGSDAPKPVPDIWNLYNGDRAFADV